MKKIQISPRDLVMLLCPCLRSYSIYLSGSKSMDAIL